jgi:hypothetical protein
MVIDNLLLINLLNLKTEIYSDVTRISVSGNISNSALLSHIRQANEIIAKKTNTPETKNEGK